MSEAMESQEMPIAVAEHFCIFRRPDGPKDLPDGIRIYADGRFWSGGRFWPDAHLTPEQVRQVCAALEFPSCAFEAMEWEIAMTAANRRAGNTRITERGTA